MSVEVEQATSVDGNLSLSDITSWDEHHANPKAEIILVSSDKVGFRVDAWHFQKESAFFRDLITFPSDQALESTLIPFDNNKKVVRYFIDFIMNGSTSTAQISMKEFEELFQLSDKYMVEKVDEALMVAMALRTQQQPTPQDLDPWTVFQFAAKRNNAELARASIRAFDGAGFSHSDIYQATVSKFAAIPGGFVAGLMLAGFNIQYNHGRHMSPYIQIRSWGEVDRFHVE